MRHFLDCSDFSKEELIAVLKLALHLKNNPTKPLADKSVALIFEKPSLRTRVSFERGVEQLGGQSLVIKGDEISLGTREPIKDVSRVLSRLVDMVMIRTFSHEGLKEFAAYSSVPVINGLSDFSHPCQALADFLTIIESAGSLDNQKICYLGDGNNVCRSLVTLAKILGVDYVVSTPDGHKLDENDYNYEKDPIKAVQDATVLYTDTWVSMGEEESGKSISVFEPYQINQELLSKAAPNAIVLHCLPAHRGEEITDEVFESAQSQIFNQAENRLHAQKAVMATLIQSI